MGQPSIDITFIQKAVTAIQRSERGVACVVVLDDSKATAGHATYKYAADVPSDGFTAANLAAIRRCWLCNVNKVIVVWVPTDAEFADVQAILETLSYNYVCVCDDSMQQDLASYLVTKNTNSPGKKYIGVVTGVTTADSKYIINVKNATVHDVDTNTTIDMAMYLPRLTSVLANLPMNRSITYYELEDIDDVDLSFVDTDNTIDDAIDDGNLVLWIDEDKVKVGRGVNTLTTITATDTADMKKIIIVESMNIILEDIYSTFKDFYIGKYKNSYDNQCLFISAVNSYFRQLAREEILDPEYDNCSYVDVEAQREAWLAIGKTAAADWTEAEVKKMTFKSYIYLAGQVKILDAIEDLHFVITME